MVEIIKGAVIPCGPKSLAEPEKELRFTRAAQAPLFFGLSVVFLIMTLAVFILSTQDWGMGGPILDGWLWLCLLGLLFDSSQGRLQIVSRSSRRSLWIVTKKMHYSV